jgi:hypothetical protein
MQVSNSRPLIESHCFGKLEKKRAKPPFARRVTFKRDKQIEKGSKKKQMKRMQDSNSRPLTESHFFEKLETRGKKGSISTLGSER